MTAACFKPTCMIYWLIWIITLSFLFGIIHVEVTFSFLHDQGVLHLYMEWVCAVVIMMAILGCCCIKCDVTHICCIFWYMAITLSLTLGLCGAIFIYLRSAPKFVDSGLDILSLVQSSWPKIPLYLQNAQNQYDCCGLFGFKDYRAFIYPASYDGDDVPTSCCGPKQDLDYQNECILRDKAPNPLQGLFISQADVTLPIEVPRKLTAKQKEDLINFITKLYGPNATTEFKNDDYFSRSGFPDAEWLLPNQSKLGNYYEKGCFGILRENGRTIHTYYYGFCFFLIASAVLMSVLLTQNCLKARREEHENALVNSQATSEIKVDTNATEKVDTNESTANKEVIVT